MLLWRRTLDELRRKLQELKSMHDRFNPFFVLGTTGREETHSRMLKWLLTPTESHGLGAAILEECAAAAGLDRAALGQHPYVESEKGLVRGHGSGRMDLLIRDKRDEPDFVCVMELKTYSEEHHNQLMRYQAYAKDDGPMLVGATCT
jgi:hypothetical protein